MGANIKELVRGAARHLVPKEYRPKIRKGLYDLQDFVGLGIPNLLKYQTFDTFDWVNFELNGNCNFNTCWYCPNSVASRRSGMMSNEVFKTMVTQLSDIGRSGFAGTITPTFFGEPTMYEERLSEKIREVKKNLPEATVLIHTNGILLDEYMFCRLRYAGVNKFIVTRHPRAPMAKFDHLLSWADGEARSMIVDRTLDNIKLYQRLPYVPIPDDRLLRLERCKLPTTQLTIAYNGDVLLCSSDFSASNVFGNIMDNDISKIWKSEAMVRVRNQNRRGDFELPTCKTCMGKSQDVVFPG